MNNKPTIYLTNSRPTQLSEIDEHSASEWSATMSAIGLPYTYIGFVMKDDSTSGSLVGLIGAYHCFGSRITINEPLSDCESVGDIG